MNVDIKYICKYHEPIWLVDVSPAYDIRLIDMKYWNETFPVKSRGIASSNISLNTKNLCHCFSFLWCAKIWSPIFLWSISISQSVHLHFAIMGSSTIFLIFDKTSGSPLCIFFTWDFSVFLQLTTLEQISQATLLSKSRKLYVLIISKDRWMDPPKIVFLYENNMGLSKIQNEPKESVLWN